MAKSIRQICSLTRFEAVGMHPFGYDSLIYLSLVFSLISLTWFWLLFQHACLVELDKFHQRYKNIVYIFYSTFEGPTPYEGAFKRVFR